MKKRLLFVLLPALMLSIFSLSHATVVQVGEGTGTTSYMPFNGGYDYNYSQQIYTHAQIGHFGPISKIRFFYSSGSIANNKDWTIYMGHTTKNVFTSNTDWEPLANLTQVFAGDVSSLLPAPNNWMEITLDTPFFYNSTNENLLVAVHEYTPDRAVMNWGSFSNGYGVDRGIQYYSYTENPDPNSPPEASGRTTTNCRIQLVFFSTQAPPAPSLWSPIDNCNLVAGESLLWKPTASIAETRAYDLYLGTTANPPLYISNLTTPTYQPALQPNTTYYWRVVAKNEIGSSPPSELRSFRYLGPVPEESVQVGEGTTTTSYLPFNGGYDYNYSQQIYTHAQIKRFGQITKLRFYYVSAGDIGYNKNWTIYLGHTTKNTFTSNTDWEDMANLTQVFAGDVSSLLPAPGNWMEIPLDIPYFYNNTNENLLVAIHEYALGKSPMNWGSFSNGYGVDRGIQYYSYTINPDPNNPPTASSRTTNINRIQLVFSSTQTPSAPTLWNPFNNGVLAAGDRLYWKPTVSVSAPTNYDLYLGTTANPPLFAGNLTTTSYQPTLQPNTTYYWKVVAKNGTGSSPPSEVRSFRYLAPVPEETVQIGDGTTTTSYLPYNGSYDYNYSQQIYTHAQIMRFGQITKLRFYYASAGDIGYGKNWTIWLGHTGKKVFDDNTDWEDTANLTLVFAGDVSSLLPEPGNWMEIPLDTPFFYNNSENLLVAIHEYALGTSPMNWGTFSNGYGVDRGIQYYSYTTNPDPNNLPTASSRTTNINRIQLVFSSTQAPPAPSLWSPVNNGNLVAGDRLYWKPTASVSAPTNYDLYLGTTANPPLYANNITQTSYLPTLLPNTTYYWKVVAKNGTGSSPASEVWSFRSLDSSHAVTAQIGDGTAATSYLPYNGSYDYNYSQQIYTHAQIRNSGQITKLRFYYASGDIGYGKNWTIWLGHTSKKVFDGNTDWEDMANLTQVFVGDISSLLPEPDNWMEIPLDTPFFYNNSENLLVAIHEYALGTSAMNWGSFSNGHGVDRGIQYYSYTTNPDPNNPPTATNKTSNINRIQLVFSNNLVPPAPSLWSPANGGYYVEGDRLYWAPVADVSGSTNYDLYLGTTANPPLIAGNLSSTFYLPTLQPNTIYYWKVVAKNERYSSAPSEVWSFRTLDSVQAATVQVGEETATTSYLPFNGSYDYNYSQQIYTQAQIDHSALITKIRLYYVSGDIANGKKWTIYMGHTSKTVFGNNTDWEDMENLTLVFDGDVSLLLPEPDNWMEIPLQTPFFYNNSGNLLIAIHESTLCGKSVVNWGSLYNGYGINRGIQYYSYTINPDPCSPPAASGRADRINKIQIGFVTPPPPPPVVEVTISGANALLTWEAIPDVSSYKVYASEDPYAFGPDPIATVNTNSYTLPLTAAKLFFKVTAVAEP